MIQKIKEVLAVKEEVATLKKDISQVREEVSGLHQNICAVQKKMDDFARSLTQTTDTVVEQVSRMNAAHGDITAIHEQFSSALREFQLETSRIEQKLLSHAQTEIAKSVERVRTDVRQYNDLKQELEVITRELQKLRAEIAKFTVISAHIKERDFEASSFAKKIFDADREKLELMKKVDTLERLVARMRRGQ
ncbi:hypothetical protein COY95_02470 [Candidatus Woesearchaeota archaeon CG_4_10_14_0_8_um_filter_47_5]|nr:MAG: hypothetical protein COY95_02470 [Candidatus Woesearchaeota archaeon CG_4_10_14_0_8_um_filter_47_5]